MEFGIDATLYSLEPGKREPLADWSETIPLELQGERALEPSLYISDELEITPWLSVTAGIGEPFIQASAPGASSFMPKECPEG